MDNKLAIFRARGKIIIQNNNQLAVFLVDVIAFLATVETGLTFICTSQLHRLQIQVKSLYSFSKNNL
jgi:hypothetical protein